MLSFVQNLTSALKATGIAGDSNPRQDKNRRKEIRIADERGSSPHDSMNGEETSMSVKALILFFENYLEDKLGQNQETTQFNDTLKPWMKSRHSNNNGETVPSYKVAGIYEDRSKYAFGTQGTQNTPAPDIRSELKDIYFIIQDLRILHEHGVKSLSINTDTQFMKSIHQAIEMHLKDIA